VCACIGKEGGGMYVFMYWKGGGWGVSVCTCIKGEGGGGQCMYMY
jgi:hypothetical protein